MSDEIETTIISVGPEDLDDTEPDEPTPPAEEPAPAAPEVDKSKEYEDKEAALKKRERELNEGFRRVAEREKALERPAAVEPKHYDGVDDEARDAILGVVNDALGDKLGKVDILDTIMADIVESEFERAAEKTGVSVDALRDALQDAGVQPRELTRKGIRDAIAVAHDIIKARTFDPVAERDKLKAEILAELKAEGIEKVESIESGGRVELDEGADIEDSELSDDERYAALKSRGFKLKR